MAGGIISQRHVSGDKFEACPLRLRFFILRDVLVTLDYYTNYTLLWWGSGPVSRGSGLIGPISSRDPRYTRLYLNHGCGLLPDNSLDKNFYLEQVSRSFSKPL